MSTPQQKLQAFESVQKFGKMFPGLIEALQEWATIGSLEQATEEAKRQLSDLKREQLFTASRIDAAKQEAERIMAEVKGRAAEYEKSIETTKQKLAEMDTHIKIRGGMSWHR